jgi:glycosyltransferase involved in cell wall biosynthesis
VTITKNRPEMIKYLLKSILKTRLASCSIVLIDDSSHDNFIQTRRFLQSLSIPFKQLSSQQAGRLVEETLKKTNLTTNEKNFIKYCSGLKSPFCGYVEPFLEPSKPKPDLSSCLRFSPYSPARNLGIYSAVKFFNPDIIVFLDDDCIILYPEKLYDQLQLIETKLNQKTIVAVAGLYRNLFSRLLSEDKISKKILNILRGIDMFLKESFLPEKARFKTMPSHMLGGALILHKKAFSVVPFDPYIARGEDHAYALDLKIFLAKNEVAIQDNCFIIDHQKETCKNASAQKRLDLNVLRDIFRFVYSHAKTGRSFITLFSVRWALTSLFNLFLNPSNYQQYKNELCSLLFIAPEFAKEKYL